MLSEDQETALMVYQAGANLLLIGAGGTGKSFLITKIFRESSVITSTTGVSAFNVRGITIHSFLGIGTGSAPFDVLLRRVRKNRAAVDRIRTATSVVIDEVSMLSASLFEKMDRLCRWIRTRPDAPFGGIRLVLSGDFFQLSPVFDDSSDDHRLVFESPVFTEMFGPDNTVILRHNHRQDHAGAFHSLLMRVREGEHTTDDIDALTSRLDTTTPAEGLGGVHLVSTKLRAAEINAHNMSMLSTDPVLFESKFACSGGTEANRQWLMDELWSQLEQRDLNRVVLKKGCSVMLVMNMDVESGLVNGRTGVVSDIIKNHPVVSFDGGDPIIITPTTMSIDHNGATCTATFTPLIPAYALTIHKSQSLTLDRAILELGGCFTDHMVYVALSRVRTIDGISLLTFNPKKIRVNPSVVSYMQKVQEQSA